MSSSHSPDEGASTPPPPGTPNPVWDRIRRWIGPGIGLALLGGALYVLHRELAAVSYRELRAGMAALPAWRIAVAVALTTLNYLVLTEYDQLAFVYIKRRIERSKILFASFIAYALANSLGMSMVSGASVRYRFYTRWGLDAADLSRVVFFYGITYWLGLLFLGGASLAAGHFDALGVTRASLVLRGVGFALVGVCLAYGLAIVVRRRPFRIRRFEIHLPKPATGALQFFLSSLDWMLAAAVLWVLLPPNTAPYSAVFTAFVVAQLAGVASQLPGGVGVFESTLVVLLRPMVEPSELLPAILLYRVIYYILPLAAALLLLAADEVRVRRAHLERAAEVLGSLTEELAPRLLAVFTFMAGALLLFSSVTPAAAGRLGRIGQILPLGLLEVSHFVAAMSGVALLVVSQGLARRLLSSLYLVILALAVGAVASLLKATDWEEALSMLLVLLALYRGRAHFDRRTEFFASHFSASWITATVAVVAASLWLGLFSFKHQQYTHEMWRQFSLHREVSRSLRASVGAGLVLLYVGAKRLTRPAPPEAEAPSATDLQAAARAIAVDRSTSAALALLDDKALMFNDARTAFIMYGVQGRTWVALGDPVGPVSEAPRLVRAFLERCDDFKRHGVFYEVSRDRLPHYADFGLTFVELGEEAIVPLESFDLGGEAGAAHGETLRRLAKEGATFRVAPIGDVPALLHELRDVSDEWLGHRSVAEKGFSHGFFDPVYLSQFPVALIERAGRIQAFANLWTARASGELSTDLLRFREGAPDYFMDALFLHLFLWGKAQGLRRFNLGMAPLPGVDKSPVAPLWTKIGAYVSRYGETFADFHALRAYKEKFAPVWEPRYLAYPGGIGLPRVLADVSALVAGGYRRILES